jgi:hypothetical protein
MGVDRGKFILIILDLMKRGFLDLLDPSNDPEFFWQVISGPPCISVPRYIRKRIARNFFSLGQLYRKFSLGKISA